MTRSEVTRLRRGPGKPFVKGDPRINHGGVPVETKEFNNRFRKDMVGELFKLTEDGETTYFQQGIQKLAQSFAAGQSWAIDLVFDRLVGKPKVSLGTDDGLLDITITRIGGKSESEPEKSRGLLSAGD